MCVCPVCVRIWGCLCLTVCISAETTASRRLYVDPCRLSSLYIWVIPREVAQENPRPPSILMKIDKPIVPHD